jgi:hypothetical protein
MANNPEDRKRGISTGSVSGESPVGRYYFFGIGIDRYVHFPSLENAVKDVRDIWGLLTTHYQFKAADSVLLFNEEATRERIMAILDDFVERFRPEDSLLIFYSGHGHLQSRTGRGFWIPVDAQPGRTAQFISNTRIKNYIEDISSRHTLLISDACFSGSLFVRGKTRSSLAVDELEKRRSRWAFCSGRHDEEVYDGEPGQNSPFTGSILKVLSHNQIPKLNLLKVIDEVIDLTRARYRQLPEGNPLFDTGHEGGQFVFHLKKGMVKQEAYLPHPEPNAIKEISSKPPVHPWRRYAIRMSGFAVLAIAVWLFIRFATPGIVASGEQNIPSVEALMSNVEALGIEGKGLAITVENGIVDISGTVSTAVDSARIDSLLRVTPGIDSLNSNIVVMIPAAGQESRPKEETDRGSKEEPITPEPPAEKNPPAEAEAPAVEVKLLVPSIWKDSEVLVDGKPVPVNDKVAVYILVSLPQGKHELQLVSGDQTCNRSVTIDSNTEEIRMTCS